MPDFKSCWNEMSVKRVNNENCTNDCAATTTECVDLEVTCTNTGQIQENPSDMKVRNNHTNVLVEVSERTARPETDASGRVEMVTNDVFCDLAQRFADLTIIDHADDKRVVGKMDENGRDSIGRNLAPTRAAVGCEVKWLVSESGDGTRRSHTVANAVKILNLASEVGCMDVLSCTANQLYHKVVNNLVDGEEIKLIETAADAAFMKLIEKDITKEGGEMFPGVQDRKMNESRANCTKKNAVCEENSKKKLVADFVRKYIAKQNQRMNVAKKPINSVFPLPTTEEDDPAKQMKKLSRDWILVALNAPNAMQQIVAQFRLIVEGFWPFNNPLLMNVPHPDIMHVIAEEMQTILIKCEAKTLGYPSVAAQPHSLPHFCNFLMLLGHLISEFVTLPYQVPDFFMDIAFRSCVLCLQPPLQWQLAQALVRFWRMVGQEMESRVPEFSELVDGMRDAVLFAERAHTAGDDDGPDPKALLIEALELRARGWRKATKSGEGDGGASSGDPACVSALSEALARASLRVDSFGAAGDCGPRVASAHAI